MTDNPMTPSPVPNPTPNPVPNPIPEPVLSPASVLNPGPGTNPTPGTSRLEIDGTWHRISPRYVRSQVVQYLLILAIFLIAAIVLTVAAEQTWVWFPFGVVVVITVIALIVLPRQARALGFMLRGDDLVFRRGILWQRMVAVPYGRMQLVDIIQGPLDRAFRVSKLKMVTAAASTGVEIPGLPPEQAEELRDELIRVAETRRTGL